MRHWSASALLALAVLAGCGAPQVSEQNGLPAWVCDHIGTDTASRNVDWWEISFRGQPIGWRVSQTSYAPGPDERVLVHRAFEQTAYWVRGEHYASQVDEEVAVRDGIVTIRRDWYSADESIQFRGELQDGELRWVLRTGAQEAKHEATLSADQTVVCVWGEPPVFLRRPRAGVEAPAAVALDPEGGKLRELSVTLLDQTDAARAIRLRTSSPELPFVDLVHGSLEAGLSQMRFGALKYTRADGDAVLAAASGAAPRVALGIKVASSRALADGQLGVLRIPLPEGLDRELIHSSDYQHVRRMEDAWLVRLQAADSVTVNDSDNVARARWKQTTSEPQQQELERVAHEWSAGAETRHAQLAALAAAVKRHITEPGGKPMASAAEAYESGVGDCTEQSALLCALLRSIDVPARTAIGLIYHNGALQFHAWVEAMINDRWEPVDSTRGRVGELPPAYLLLGYDYGDEEAPRVLEAVSFMLTLHCVEAVVEDDREQ